MLSHLSPEGSHHMAINDKSNELTSLVKETKHQNCFLHNYIASEVTY